MGAVKCFVQYFLDEDLQFNIVQLLGDDKCVFVSRAFTTPNVTK
jgi:hypothetical protein